MILFLLFFSIYMVGLSVGSILTWYALTFFSRRTDHEGKEIKELDLFFIKGLRKHKKYDN